MPAVKVIASGTEQSTAKLRVAAYCRVSSNSEDQKHSYAQQVQYYNKYIRQRAEWELVEVFADEGLSGMKADNRPDFQRMIHLCQLRQIDLIITKSISRFGRNVKETLEYVRKLKILGVGVMFEKESINTLCMGDEMLLNTFSAIAQEESKAISQNMRLSIVKRMELGDFVDSNAPYGFRLIDKKLWIYEPEAQIVKQIFDLYLNGWSTHEIAREFNARSIPTKMGTGKWTSHRIAYILSNEKYVGDCRYQKTFRDTTVPFVQHPNRGQSDMFYATNTHEGFIKRDIFDQVQVLLQNRKHNFYRATTQNIYPLTSRIRCSVCGAFFRRKKTAGTVKWVCATHEENAKSCESSYYSEERIYDGFIAMVNHLRFGEDDVLGHTLGKIDAAINQYKRNCKAARTLSHSIAEINAQIFMLEQLHSKGYLAADVYQAQARTLKKQISQLKLQRQDTLESQLLEMQRDVRYLQSLLNEMEEPQEQFDETLFREIVLEISLTPRDEMTFTVLGNLRFTEII